MTAPVTTAAVDPSSSAGSSRPTTDATVIRPAASPTGTAAGSRRVSEHEHRHRSQAGCEGGGRPRRRQHGEVAGHRLVSLRRDAGGDDGRARGALEHLARPAQRSDRRPPAAASANHAAASAFGPIEPAGSPSAPSSAALTRASGAASGVPWSRSIAVDVGEQQQRVGAAARAASSAAARSLSITASTPRSRRRGRRRRGSRRRRRRRRARRPRPAGGSSGARRSSAARATATTRRQCAPVGRAPASRARRPAARRSARS